MLIPINCWQRITQVSFCVMTFVPLLALRLGLVQFSTIKNGKENC